ncbi:putative membrane protein [Salirhabdus euzebyi]|uniref:Putative membrane protein n=1 Tax=Salirhabdus euzebyi TaxID=394506 RepID=A0A841Q1C6_9BACI|nr:putative membrane protein [Salirhabdus euzebyi]
MLVLFFVEVVVIGLAIYYFDFINSWLTSSSRVIQWIGLSLLLIFSLHFSIQSSQVIAGGLEKTFELSNESYSSIFLISTVIILLLLLIVSNNRINK